MATQTNQAPSVGGKWPKGGEIAEGIQIQRLRTEAAQAGDHAQVLLCDRALGAVTLDDDTTIESLRIAAFLSASDKRRIAALTDEECWGACLDALSQEAA
jgi:hypothetical protein